MTQNFRLPSLHLGSSLDEPIVPLAVPGMLAKGADPALCMLDGANRAPHRLSRLVRPVGLLGVKLARPESGVRVTLHLVVDDLSTMLWDRHRLRLLGESLPEDDDYVPTNVSRRHRLLEVTAQGRSRALVLLALRPADDGTLRQRISFELSAEEIGESGLVMVGLEPPRSAPSWARERGLEDPAVGTCVARMIVDPAQERVAARASTGRPRIEHSAIAVANPGFFVVNPAAGGGPATVSISPRGVGGGRLQGRRAKVKHPLRFARETYQDRRLETAAPAAVEVVDLDGETLLEAEVPQGGDGRHEFTVTGGGSVYVRARKVVGGELRSVNWGVRLRPAD